MTRLSPYSCWKWITAPLVSAKSGLPSAALLLKRGKKIHFVQGKRGRKRNCSAWVQRMIYNNCDLNEGKEQMESETHSQTLLKCVFIKFPLALGFLFLFYS